MNKKDSDQYFYELLQGDQIGQPDQKVENRLMCSFLLKSSKSKPRQNSFNSFFSWLYSVQSIGLKASLASFILLLTLVNHNINLVPGKTSVNDSIYNKQVLVADSTGLSKNIDSIRVVN